MGAPPASPREAQSWSAGGGFVRRLTKRKGSQRRLQSEPRRGHTEAAQLQQAAATGSPRQQQHQKRQKRADGQPTSSGPAGKPQALGESKEETNIDKETAPQAHQQQHSGGKLRGGLAGYLVTKLTSLTSGLGGGLSSAAEVLAAGSPTRQQARNGGGGAPRSAPATPSRHAHTAQQADPANCAAAGGPPPQPGVGGAASQRNSRAGSLAAGRLPTQQHQSMGWVAPSGPLSAFDQTLLQIATTSRDYNGCDFILLLECSLSAQSTSSGGVLMASSLVASSLGGGGGPASQQTGATLPSSGRSSLASGLPAGGPNARGSTSAASGSVSFASGADFASLASHHHEQTHRHSRHQQHQQQQQHEAGSANQHGRPSESSGANLHAGVTTTLIIHLVAPNLQEKAAWMSDISQVSKRALVSECSPILHDRASERVSSFIIGRFSATVWAPPEA